MWVCVRVRSNLLTILNNKRYDGLRYIPTQILFDVTFEKFGVFFESEHISHMEIVLNQLFSFMP